MNRYQINCRIGRYSQIVYEISVAHQYQSDHGYLVRRLMEYLMQVQEISESLALTVGKYLIINLKQNIQLVNTISCLPIMYQHMSFNNKNSVTSLVRQKYPSGVNFYHQILLLKEVNYTLIPPFLKIVSSLGSWFQAVVEQKSYKSIQSYEFQYIINKIYTFQRCKYELQMQIHHSSGESILTLYRILVQNDKIYNDLLQNNQQTKNILHSCFYFLANYDITQCIGVNKYYFSTIGGIINLFKEEKTILHSLFIELILPKLKRGTVQNAQQHIINDILLFLRKIIVNILLSCWSVQIQRFWLWKYKLFCDLLDIDDKKQYFLINQIQELFRELSKMFNY